MKRNRARSPEALALARAQRATANEFAIWESTADFCCIELKLILEIDRSEIACATIS